ncbi:MAG: hypothetical protein U9N84_11830 [Actinomycetota bacterium]|nr:hypothetical protein [Actinomycetota bacterium]
MASGIDFTSRRGGLSRRFGGIAAFAFPLALTALALSVGFRRAGDMSDLAASLLATMLFLMAAPTAWIFTVDFIEAGRLLVITSALATSLPLWFLAGSRLAYFENHWSGWLRRYVVLCVVWSVFNVVLMVIVGSLTG